MYTTRQIVRVRSEVSFVRHLMRFAPSVAQGHVAEAVGMPICDTTMHPLIDGSGDMVGFCPCGETLFYSLGDGAR